MTNLAVIVLTFNEEKHIKRCLDSVFKIAEKVYIIDSFSTDNTLSIASKYNTKIIQREWKNNAEQFQYALNHFNIDNEWTMKMDADEYLTDLLVEELKEELHNSNDINSFYLNLRVIFKGKQIRFGESPAILRVWKTGSAKMEQRWMDEHIVVENQKSKKLRHHFIDHNLNNSSWWIEKHNKYASREAVEILNQKYHFLPIDKDVLNAPNNAKYKRLVKVYLYNQLPIIIRPILYFTYRYFIKLGFLDGIRGFFFHFFQGFWYRMLVDLKYYEGKKLIAPLKSKEEMRNELANHFSLKL